MQFLHKSDKTLESMAGYCLELEGGGDEVGVEQFFRDVTIALTWEGTNGIQAYALNILIYLKNYRVYSLKKAFQ